MGVIWGKSKISRWWWSILSRKESILNCLLTRNRGFICKLAGCGQLGWADLQEGWKGFDWGGRADLRVVMNGNGWSVSAGPALHFPGFGWRQPYALTLQDNGWRGGREEGWRWLKCCWGGKGGYSGKGRNLRCSAARPLCVVPNWTALPMWGNWGLIEGGGLILGLKRKDKLTEAYSKRLWAWKMKIM